MLCFHACLFVDALWSPAGKGLTSWLSFVMSNFDVVTFSLVSWVRCDAWLYRFLIFTLFLTLMCCLNFSIYLLFICFGYGIPIWWKQTSLCIVIDYTYHLCKPKVPSPYVRMEQSGLSTFGLWRCDNTYDPIPFQWHDKTNTGWPWFGLCYCEYSCQCNRN